MPKYVISSGHSLKVRGAKYYIDEVNEARKVVDAVHEKLTKDYGNNGVKFHDNTSTTQSTNIRTIVNNHNNKQRVLDISIHFNAFKVGNEPKGTEVLYVNPAMKDHANKFSKDIATAGGLKNRGAKYRKDLGFLNGTTKPALLIEVCFVDSKADADLYFAKFESIVNAIVQNIATYCKLTKKTTKPTDSSKTTQQSTTKTPTYYYVLSGTYATDIAMKNAIAKGKRLGIYSVYHLIKGELKFKTGTYKSKWEAERALQKMKDNKILWYGEVRKH